MKILVTGGAGFIGGNFVHKLLSENVGQVLVLDKLTYAGHRITLAEWESDERYQFFEGDIGDRPLVKRLLTEFRPNAVVNFAAESHVDRSIDGADVFIQTNINGTFVLLDEALKAWQSNGRPTEFRFHHVSTDEVYGTLGATGYFTETTPFAPNSPYAASKAASDHLVRAYHHTYQLPVTITNCSNNYGPYQFPEKLIPLALMNALEGRPIPVYGDGQNVRDWLHVQDHCAAILSVLAHGRLGETYNVGGDSERTNLELLDALFVALESYADQTGGRKREDYQKLIEFVTDRPGHDRRYAIDASKIKRELGWTPKYKLEEGLRQTVGWFIENRAWCEAVTGKNYNRERLGLDTLRS